MIVGVAIKVGRFIEVRQPMPSRHGECFTYFFMATGTSVTNAQSKTGNAEQGFYTDEGIFLNRQDALAYVELNKQELIRPIQGGILTSENLW